LRGPDHYEKWQKRVRAKVDKRLNDGQPIKTIADAKRVMGEINPTFLPGPNGENPRSEASFLGGREIVPSGGGYKLDKVKFRDDDEELSEHDRNFMYSWLAQSIQTGRYDLTNWVLLSKTELDRRADYKVKDVVNQVYTTNKGVAGHTGYKPGSFESWRQEERGPVEAELGELLGDEDAPIFTAGMVPQETLKESLGWLKPSGSGYVINETGGGPKGRDKPTMEVMYASEPVVVGPAGPGDNPALVYEFEDTAGVVTKKKIYGIKDYKNPRDAMQKMENVAITQFVSVMSLLEDDNNRTADEITTKGTDAAIAPSEAYDGRRHTKRFMRMYDRARSILHDNVGQHELGHANHYLAMIEDFAKRAGALSGRKIDYKKLSEFMATGFHESLSKKKKRRLVEFTAIQAIHEAKGQWEDDIFENHIALRAMLVDAANAQAAGTPNAALEQGIREAALRLKDLFDAPIYDGRGQPVRRNGPIKKLLKQMHLVAEGMGGAIAFNYDPSDNPDQDVLTRGDLFFLLGPSVHFPTANLFASPITIHDAMFERMKLNKYGQAMTHEPWGIIPGLNDVEIRENTGWDPTSAVGDPVAIGKLSRGTLERLVEIGLPEFEISGSPSTHMDATSADDIRRLLIASGRVGGQIPPRGSDSGDNALATQNVDLKAPVKLVTAADVDSDTLLRSLIDSSASIALSDREIDDASKRIVEATVDHSAGTGQEPTRKIMKARQRLAKGSVDRDTANGLLRQVVHRHEGADWPLMLMTDGARLGSGRSALGDTNPDTGQPWAIGDDFPTNLVKQIIEQRELDAQDTLAQAFEAHGLLSEFYDDLDEAEIDILTDITKGFGGTRYTPYMGKRYPNFDGNTYAVDGTRQEIISELSAMLYSGEKIVIQNRDGDWVELSPAQKAVIDKLMKWLKPKERWGPDDA